MSKREAGTIVSAAVDTSHIETVWVQVDYDKGGSQGFGGLALQDQRIMASYVAALCDTFGVHALGDLKGLRCHALKCWEGHQETIEGLEAPDGRRFTITGWRRKQGLDFPSPLEQRRESLRRDIAEATRCIETATRQMAALAEGYTDWSQEPEAPGTTTWWERLVG